MKIELWPTSRPTPYPDNPRRNDQAVAAVARSIREFGFRQPIVVDEAGVILAGHTRLKAALQLGLAEVPVHVAETLTDAQARAYRVADNKTQDLAEWDNELLAQELLELKKLDVALEGLGFDAAELERLGAGDGTEGLVDADEVPEAPAEPITKLGDLWLLGNHRLLCGDSTKAQDVDRLMGGEKAALLITSPPYWANQEYDNKPGIQGIRAFMKDICNTWKETVIRRVCINTGNSNARSVGESDVAEKVLLDSLWVDAFSVSGWMLRTRRIWVKGGVCLHQNPISDCVDDSCEALLTFFRENLGGQERCGEPWATQGYWDFRPEYKSSDHPCPYPVELPSRFAMLYSKAGDIISDPFSGSGTTLIAAEQLGRRCYAMEIEPSYCDIAVKRWENFTGRKADREVNA